MCIYNSPLPTNRRIFNSTCFVRRWMRFLVSNQVIQTLVRQGVNWIWIWA